jgi:hypothetical protein
VRRTLGVLAHSELLADDLALEARVHLGDGGRGRVGLESAEILGSEEELAVEVALLDRVHVGDGDGAVGTGGETHHGPVLEHLAPDGAGADEELAVVGDLLLERATENCDLAIVATAVGGAVGLGERVGGDGEGLEGVKVEVLDGRVKLAAAGLEDLLRDEATGEGDDGGEVTGGLVGESGDELVVERLA